MIVRGISGPKLREALTLADLEADNLRAEGTGWAFRLIPHSSRDQWARRSPERFMGGGGRHIKATCYHGFRNFGILAFSMGATSLNTVGPHGKRVTYHSMRDFAADLFEFATMNVGSQLMPQSMIDLCDEHHWADVWANLPAHIKTVAQEAGVYD